MNTEFSGELRVHGSPGISAEQKPQPAEEGLSEEEQELLRALQQKQRKSKRKRNTD